MGRLDQTANVSTKYNVQRVGVYLEGLDWEDVYIGPSSDRFLAKSPVIIQHTVISFFSEFNAGPASNNARSSSKTQAMEPTLALDIHKNTACIPALWLVPWTACEPG